jgi:chitodextrinase
LLNGSTYYYKLSALNAIGESPLSNERFATPVAPDTTPPSVPGNLTAPETGTSQIALDWATSTDNVGVTRYRVYRDGFLIATVTNSDYLDSGLAAASIHFYRVPAVDAAGNESLPSISVSATTATLGNGSKGTLAGVVFSQSATLVANAIATVVEGNGTVKMTTTGATGAWMISNLSAGTYTIAITLGGYQSTSVSMTAIAGQMLLSLAKLS